MILKYHISKGSLWFRVLGKGLSIENSNIIPARFSERIGKKKKIKLLCFRVTILN